MEIKQANHISQGNNITIENNYHLQCETSSIMFPYHCDKVVKPDRFHTIVERLLTSPTRSRLFSSFNVFPKVYASDDSNNVNVVKLVNVGETQPANAVHTSGSGEQERITPSYQLEALAKAYIAQETGRERLRVLFQKNHKGESSPQMVTMYMSLAQIFFISFFIKYIPSWKLAKEEYIKAHNATTFRTPLDARRKMNDHASLRGVIEGASFASKITIFCASFLMISQSIATYRNKTSVLEYSVAAGITGGLARLQMGPKAFVAGSVVGTLLGTLFGGVVYVLFHTFNITEEARHFEDVLSKLEVERSIVGDNAFKQRIKELSQQMDLNPSAS